ncbi:MAG: helix-turn-helix domain-containing protein [Bacteroidota bacterium]
MCSSCSNTSEQDLLTIQKNFIEAFKTYPLPSSAYSFDLKRMEQIHEQQQGVVDTPHRHDYYTVLLIHKAKGKHWIDFNSYELAENQVFFVAPGQVHQVIEEEKSSGVVLLFSRQFLIENSIRASFITEMNLFQDYGDAPPLRLDADLKEQLFDLADKMEQELLQNTRFAYEAIGAYLKLFLIACHNACDISQEKNPQLVEASLSILKTFKQLIEEHYTQAHEVRFYADYLAISADHLNKTVQRLTGKTAKTFIQSRLITEAKRLLLHSDNSAKQIAYYLGFNDPAYFSRFFKKCTQQSISAFRKAIV